MTATVPIPLPTEYVDLAGQWTVDPAFAAIEGFKRYDGVVQGGQADTGFGVDIQFQQGVASDDWEMVAHSEAVAGGGGGTVPDPLLLGSGSAAAPTYSYAADPNTGEFNLSPNALGWSTDGVNRMSLSAFGLSMAVPIALNNLVLQGPLDPTTGIGVGDRAYNDNRHSTRLGPHRLNGGSAGAPAYSYSVETTMGEYRVGAATIGWSTSSVQRMNLSVLGLGMAVPIDMGNQILRAPANPTVGTHVGDRDYNDGRYALDTVVVKIDGNQTINDDKTFSGTTRCQATEVTTLAATGNIASTTLAPTGIVYSNFLGILTNTNPSDRNLKKGIRTLKGSLDKLSRLRPVEFRWKQNPELLHHGFIAQEAGVVFPEFATTDEENEFITFNHLELIAHLVNAVEELRCEVEKLRKE
jgi:hypothetical protein